MLNYKNISGLFLVTEIALLLLVSTQEMNLLWLSIPVIIYLIFLILGSIFINLNFYLKSDSKLKNKNAVLLSFDDGPDPLITPQILDLLRKYNRKALFFLIGEKVEKYPDLVKQIYEEGHWIGNHTYTHSLSFDWKSSKKMEAEIKRCNQAVKETCGHSILIFRPPYGVSNPNLAKAVKRVGLKSVSWSFRSFDTGKKSAERISRKLKLKIRGGEILLFHDNREKSIAVLKQNMDFLSTFEQGEI